MFLVLTGMVLHTFMYIHGTLALQTHDQMLALGRRKGEKDEGEEGRRVRERRGEGEGGGEKGREEGRRGGRRGEGMEKGGREREG